MPVSNSTRRAARRRITQQDINDYIMLQTDLAPYEVTVLRALSRAYSPSTRRVRAWVSNADLDILQSLQERSLLPDFFIPDAKLKFRLNTKTGFSLAPGMIKNIMAGFNKLSEAEASSVKKIKTTVNNEQLNQLKEKLITRKELRQNIILDGLSDQARHLNNLILSNYNEKEQLAKVFIPRNTSTTVKEYGDIELLATYEELKPYWKAFNNPRTGAKVIFTVSSSLKKNIQKARKENFTETSSKSIEKKLI
jgi:hypothetical protein